MDGRIGWLPASVCHVAFAASPAMASPPRDRLMIDLRGIGDAVRAEAARRGITASQLARRALVSSLDASHAVARTLGSDGQTLDRSVGKLMLRMPQRHVDLLIFNAVALGLSYGEYVALLVEGSKLPAPIAERHADRAALLASNDQLAALSADLNVLAWLLGHGKGEEAAKYVRRLEAADAEVRRHLDRASAFIATTERNSS